AELRHEFVLAQSDLFETRPVDVPIAHGRYRGRAADGAATAHSLVAAEAGEQEAHRENGNQQEQDDFNRNVVEGFGAQPFDGERGRVVCDWLGGDAVFDGRRVWRF